MELMIPYECHRCGVVDEAAFTYSGPHIKQICNGCGKYVKFFEKSKIPDAKEIKLRIWSITQNVKSIDEIKKSIGFVNNLSGIDEKIMYWRLYLKIREVSVL